MADVTISQLTSNTPNKNTAIIPYSDGSTTYKTSPSGIVAASPGSVIQVKYGFSNNSSLGNNNEWVSCPELNVSIIPQFVSSKILVMANGTVGINTTGGQEYLFRLTRNNSEITPQGSTGTTRGYAANSWDLSSSWQISTTPMQYLDFPNSVSECIYRIQCYVQTTGGAGAYTFRWNATSDSAGVTDKIGACSSITLMEIAG